MKQLAFLLCLLLALTACESHCISDDSSVSASRPDHSHTATSEKNVIVHDPVGYCGNTVTTVQRLPFDGEEGWETSFWGGTSVGLTDFLRWLDYSGEPCRCMPEYYVKTEFGNSEYAINLSEGFVRYDEMQSQLTETQLKQLKVWIEDAAAGEPDGLCVLPSKKMPVYHH